MTGDTQTLQGAPPSGGRGGAATDRASRSRKRSRRRRPIGQAAVASAAGEAGSAIALLIVTHGDMGRSLLQAAEMIVGPLDRVASLTLDQGESLEHHRSRLVNTIESLDTGSGVLVMLDLFGGTPANAASLALQQDRVEAVSGVNLPMLIEAIQSRDQIPLSDLAVRIAEAGQRGIRDLRKERRSSTKTRQR